MDDFREWLSDNLRYILLGLAIIAVLLVLFFGIRFLTSTFGDDSKKEQKVTEQQKDTEKEQKEEKKIQRMIRRRSRRLRQLQRLPKSQNRRILWKK